MKKEVAHGYYTHDELGRFHSYNDEPAIVIESYMGTGAAGEEEWINGYKAWYDHGELINSIRNED